MDFAGIAYDNWVHLIAIWYILWLFGIFCGHLLYFMVIWNILWSFGIFCGHLVYLMAMWNILWAFGIFVVFPFLVCCTKKNLATLVAEEGLHMVEFSLNNSCKSGTAKICTYVWINP
jgi:hypothetical protein